MPGLPPFDDLGNGVYCVDTGFGRPRMAACYLVISGSAAAFIDTGTAYTAPALLALLEHLGLGPAQVEYVIPTHVHLDHAGGSGQLMAGCPNATLVVHPRGATHMIDPSKLIAGATAVYGEAVFRRDFGTLEPVAEARCIAAADGQSFSLDGRELVFIETPGHANHHGCIWDAQSGGFFTGDTFGIAYPELNTERGPWLFAPTTPVAFDPPAWHASVDRLMAFAPERMYLTHFGEIPATAQLAGRLHRSIDALAALAERQAATAESRPAAIEAAVDELLLTEARNHGVTLEDARIRELLAVDIDLNAQGLEVWLVRQEKQRGR
jgi:glyoxylase-like metal-dependent hydrolase (beta-lactamase superfamily II)